MSKPTEHNPFLRVPAAWWLAVTHGSNPHAKRKYAMLLQIAAKVAAGGEAWLQGDEADLYGSDWEYDSEPYSDAAIEQLEKEGYIFRADGKILITEKTRRLFALEASNG